ncbi:MAG: radical SAM protein, partial [Endomicrobiales bacterium]
MPAAPFPTYIQIEPSAECPLRCRMCALPFRGDRPPGGKAAFMAPEVFESIVDQCAGAQRLHLQGLGEPLAHPQFFSFVSYAARKGIRVTINSSLALLDAQLAERCAAGGLSDIYVSVDAATRETYEAIRVNGRFEALLRNLELLNAARERRGSELPRVRLVAVMMKRNLHELPALVRLAEHYRMHSMFVQHLCHDFDDQPATGRYRALSSFFREETLRNGD